MLALCRQKINNQNTYIITKVLCTMLMPQWYILVELMS